MSRGEGTMGRRIIAAVEEATDVWTPLKDLSNDDGELSSLKRAAKRLEARGRVGIVYRTVDGRRAMCVTTPLLSVADAVTGRTRIRTTRQVQADQLRRRIADLDVQRARLQAQLDQLTGEEGKQ